MKVSVELNVSDKEFYDVMMKSLQEELNHVSKKKLVLKEGLKYKKKSAQRKGIGSEITVYIKKLHRKVFHIQSLVIISNQEWCIIWQD